MAYLDESLFEGVLKQYGKSRMKPFVKSAKRFIETGQETPESAADLLRAEADVRGWKRGRVEKKASQLAGRIPQSIDTARYGYLEPSIQQTYQTILGRSATPEEVQRSVSYASASRINPNDPGAFGAFLNDLTLASPEGRSKYKTEQDIEWELNFGPMVRDASGQRGRFQFNPGNVSSLVSTMLGA